MKALTGNTNQIDKSTTFIPVLNGWTASRNLDPMNKEKFRTWFAHHKQERNAAQRTKAAREISAAASRVHNAGEKNLNTYKADETSLPTSSTRKED